MSYGYDDQDMLNSDDKRVAEARGVLSKLWRQLLMVLDIDGWKWDRLMRIYLTDPRNGIQNNSRDRSSARGNLNKELKRDDMTWRVFLKALNFLDPIRVVFTVRITFKDGRTHEVFAKIKDRGPMPEALIPEVEDEVLDTGTEAEDETDEMLVTEHRPSYRRNANNVPFRDTDIINAINGKSNR